ATRSGRLTWLDFPSERIESLDLATPAGFEELFGALDIEPVNLGENRMDLLVEVESEAAVRELDPDFDAIGRLSRQRGNRGLIVSAPAEAGAGYDFVSRFFAPALGIDEDPVTGSAHCALAPYWSDRLGQDELLGYQMSDRGGYVHVRVVGDRVHLGGEAVTVFAGEMRVTG
ncbi:MAG: PhzF family phenazine biosynthesis protein, partial [Rhodothermia bacterium]